MARIEIEETELAALRRQAAKAEAELEKYKDYDAIKGERDTYKTRLGELNAGREKAAFEALGVDGEKRRAFIKMEFESLPAEGKPADVATWLEGMKADTTKIPAELAFAFQVPAANTQAGGASGQGQRPPVTVPNVNAGTQEPPVGGAKWTKEAIDGLSLADYSARRAEIFASSSAIKAATQGLPGTTPPPAAPPAR